MLLALSGGGFRATLFHLGVISYLRKTGRLNHVEKVYSVSGGSIAAAHLILNWHKYTADDGRLFNEAAQGLVSLCRSDMRGRIVRRWLMFVLAWAFVLVVAPSLILFLLGVTIFSGTISLIAAGLVLALAIASHKSWSLTNLLVLEYDKFFASAKTRDLDNGSAPELHILSTNLTTGQLASFTQRGLTLYNNSNVADNDTNTLEHTALPVSLAVAASSAFPPLFSPVPITDSLLGVNAERMPFTSQLSDGGVYDNLGIRAIRAGQPNDFAGIVLSNAGRSFEWDTKGRFGFLPTRAARATDILMERVGTLETDIELHRGQVTAITLGTDLEGSRFLAGHIQRKVRNIRTDLDAFSPVEIQLLVYRGFCAARHAFEKVSDIPDGITLNAHGVPVVTSAASWLPFGSDIADTGHDADAALKTSHQTKLRIFTLYDWASWATVLLVVLMSLFSYPSLTLFRNSPRMPTGLEMTIYRLPKTDALMKKHPAIKHLLPTNAPRPADFSDPLGESPDDEAAHHPEYAQDMDRCIDALLLGEHFANATCSHPAKPFRLTVVSAVSDINIVLHAAIVLPDTENTIIGPFLCEKSSGKWHVDFPRSDGGSRAAVIITLCPMGDQEVPQTGSLDNYINYTITKAEQ